MGYSGRPRDRCTGPTFPPADATCKERGLDVKEAFSHIIFYYGQCSIPKPFSLTGAELDEHFGFPVYEAVEEANKHYMARLFAILAGD
jgi:hypothetical protein